MSKTEEKQKKQSKKITERYFYQKWWFWVVIGVIFAGTWAFLFIKDIDLRSSIIGICGVWGSTIATIFIGIIAARQSERYTFLAKKEDYITKVRLEEQRFLLDFDKVGNSGKYLNLAMELIFVKGEDSREQVSFMVKHSQVKDELVCFMHTITTYEYCPIRAKEMMDGCQNMLTYLQSNLNLSQIPDVLEEGFQEKCVACADYIMAWQEKMRLVKTKYIIGFQILINALTKCKDLDALNKQMKIISRKTQKMREELALYNYFDRKENAEKEQEKND